METLPAPDQLSGQETTTPAAIQAAPTDYDNPWKEAIEQYFAPFLTFFFPVVHAEPGGAVS